METINEKSSNSGQVMGIIAIVLGVMSLIMAFVPCIGLFAFVPGVIGVTFGIVSILQANNAGASKGLGIGGTVVSAIAIIMSAVWLFLFNKIIDSPSVITDKIEKFSKKFSDELLDSVDAQFDENSETTILIVSDSMKAENLLRQMEHDDVDGVKITVNGKSLKSGKTKGSTTNKTTVTIVADSVKVQRHK